MRKPKLSFHAGSRCWYVHTRKHGDVYFSRDFERSQDAYERWMREHYPQPSAGPDPISIAGLAVQFWERAPRPASVKANLLPFVKWCKARELVSPEQLRWDGPGSPSARLVEYGDYLAERYRPETRRHYGMVVNAWLKWLHARGKISAQDLRVPLPNTRLMDSPPRCLPPAVREQILRDTPNARTRTVFQFLYLTAARPGEVVEMRWCDVDLANGLVRLPEHKTSKSTGQGRALVLPSAARGLMGPPGQPDGYVFTRRSGKPFTVRSLHDAFGRVAPAGCTLYQLRHSRAQDLLDNGAPVDVVARVLGHRGLKMIQKYALPAEPRVRQVLDALVPAVAP